MGVLEPWGGKMGPMRGQGIPPGRQVRVPGDPSFQDMDRLGVGCHWGKSWGNDGPRLIPEKPRTFSERESKFTVKFFTLQFFAHFSSLIYVAFILGRYGPPALTCSLTLEMETHTLFNFQNESSSEHVEA